MRWFEALLKQQKGLAFEISGKTDAAKMRSTLERNIICSSQLRAMATIRPNSLVPASRLKAVPLDHQLLDLSNAPQLLRLG